MILENKNQVINYIIELEAANGISKEQILAIFSHGSSTIPYIDLKNRDLDFIVITNNAAKIDKEFTITHFNDIKIEIFTYNYTYFITEYCSLDNKIIPHYCYIRLLYTNNIIKSWPVPFDKTNQKIINTILYEFLNKFIGNRYSKNKDKYFYWFLVWAKDLGANIADTEIVKAHDYPNLIDKNKYKWIIGFIKSKYNIQW